MILHIFKHFPWELLNWICSSLYRGVVLTGVPQIVTFFEPNTLITTKKGAAHNKRLRNTVIGVLKRFIQLNLVIFLYVSGIKWVKSCDVFVWCRQTFLIRFLSGRGLLGCNIKPLEPEADRWRFFMWIFCRTIF